LIAGPSPGHPGELICQAVRSRVSCRRDEHAGTFVDAGEGLEEANLRTWMGGLLLILSLLMLGCGKSKPQPPPKGVDTETPALDINTGSAGESQSTGTPAKAKD
jgi:hypothetical protein